MSVDWASHRAVDLGRRWEPNAHPRLPVGPGGGRFESIWKGPARKSPSRMPLSGREAAKRDGYLREMEDMYFPEAHEKKLQKQLKPALAHLEDLAPGAYRTLDHVWFNDHGNNVNANYGEYNDFDGGEPIIHLNEPTVFGDQAVEDFKKMRDQGFTAPWPEGMTPAERTLYHEFGHHLQWHAERTDPTAGERWVREARNHGLPIGVGGRANQGDKELIAELWTEYATMGAKARPAAHKVGTMMQRAGQR